MKSTGMVVAAFVSWLGLFVHNVADLPGQTVLSPESSIPLAVYLVVVLAWLGWPSGRRVLAWALLGIGLLNVVGGAILSVLPVPLWPFDPEQSLYHYAFHLLYGVLQVPLLIVAGRFLRGR